MGLLREYFSNVIYRRVGRGHAAKNPHGYELVQENLDMQRNIPFNS